MHVHTRCVEPRALRTIFPSWFIRINDRFARSVYRKQTQIWSNGIVFPSSWTWNKMNNLSWFQLVVVIISFNLCNKRDSVFFQKDFFVQFFQLKNSNLSIRCGFSWFLLVKNRFKQTSSAVVCVATFEIFENQLRYANWVVNTSSWFDSRFSCCVNE